MSTKAILAAAAALAAVATTMTATSAEAFSTGGHYRATDEGLRAAGLGQGAIDLANIANYQTDYITNKPTYLELARAEKVGKVATYFHFDDLRNASAVERNLGWMEAAAKRMALNGRNANDPEKALNGLGIVLHAVQDLYSHSNVADKNWPALAGDRVVTLDDVPEDIWKAPQLANVFEGTTSTTQLGIFGANAGSSILYGTPTHASSPFWPEHGGESICDGTSLYCGMNHDAVTRRDALTAQQMAIRATTQWANKFRAWVGEPFWTQMRNYSGGFVGDCMAKMQETATAAGEWAYPTGKSYAKMVGWGIYGEGCQWDWQDTRWSNVILDAFEATVPDHMVIDGTTYPPASSRQYDLPVLPPLPLEDFVGTYSITWGASSGLLTLSVYNGAIRATLTTAGGTARQIGIAVPNGNALDLNNVGGLSGKIYLMAETRNAVAGFVRNESGVPNGIYGSKANIVVMPLPPLEMSQL